MGPILLVEDDEDVREEAAEALRDAGHLVVTAENGVEALIRAREHKPRLILLDLMMPVMDGWACRRELLRDGELARIPVIIVSGAGSIGEERDMLRANGILKKPYRAEDLLQAIARSERSAVHESR